MMKGIDMKKINAFIFLSFAIIFLLVGCAKSPSVPVKDEPKIKPAPAVPAVEKKPIVTHHPPEPAFVKDPVVKRSTPDSKVWVHYSKTKQGDNYFNKTNIAHSSNILTVSIYKIATDHCRKQMIEEIKKYNTRKAVKYQYYEHDIRVDEVDCKNQKWRVKELTHYDDKGNVLDHYTYENEKWENIKFVTDHHTLQKNICVAQEKPSIKIKKKKK